MYKSMIKKVIFSSVQVSRIYKSYTYHICIYPRILE